jgi:1-acyl-sn-glycerol-3-phosphate acyltransferase
MLRTLLANLRGSVSLVLLTGNLFLTGGAVLVMGLLKFLLRGEWRRRWILLTARMAECWVAVNRAICKVMLPTRWELEGVEGLDPERHYLIMSNHQSWLDIPALQFAFHRRAPFIRFFLKQELIWLPVVGVACWGLEFPFMKRYSEEYLRQHPEKRGTDLATTRRACERYRHLPVSILNFVEGTRFTQEKHDQQQSPYRHLLKPRVGGISYVLASMGEQLDAVLDVTVSYPGVTIDFWRFLRGEVPRAVVRVRRLSIPERFYSAAVTEPGPLRTEFREWMEALWQQKDEMLATGV